MTLNDNLTPVTEEQPSATEPAAPPRKDLFLSGVGEVLQTLVLALLIFVLVRNVVANFRIEGSSMEPNFHDGQFLFINRFAYCPGLHLDMAPIDLKWSKTWCLWQPQRGDVIIFRYPRDPTKDYIKRVIGLPGDKVEVKSGEVYINDEPLPEPFGPNPGSYSAPPITVPPDQVYVMGDNRNNSSDSHMWGPLPEGYIVGRAWLSYWPPHSWGQIPLWNLGTLQAKGQ
jgi:signal peptidase I